MVNIVAPKEEFILELHILILNLKLITIANGMIEFKNYLRMTFKATLKHDVKVSLNPLLNFYSSVKNLHEAYFYFYRGDQTKFYINSSLIKTQYHICQSMKNVTDLLIASSYVLLSFRFFLTAQHICLNFFSQIKIKVCLKVYLNILRILQTSRQVL